MEIQYPTQFAPLLFFVGYFLAATISAGFAIYISRYRSRQPSAVAFGTIGVCLTIWALGYVGRMLAPTLAAKLLWTQFSWIGVTFTPVAVLAFALIFTGRGELLTRRRIGALTAIPLITQVVLFTNVHHGLFYTDVWLYADFGSVYIASRGGTYFYGVHIPYSWALYAVGTILLIQFAFFTRHIYRSQSITLVIGAIIPWIVNGTFLAGVRLHPELDPTPVGFAVGMGVIGVAVFRHAFLGLIPLARERVVQEMDEAIIIIDDRGRLADFNPAAARMFEQFGSTSPRIGANAGDVLPDVVAGYDDPTLQENNPIEVHLEAPDRDAWYLLRAEAVGVPTYKGRILSLTDITEQKQRQASLELARARVARDRDTKAAIQQLLVSTTIDQDIAANICELLVEEHGFASAWIVPPAQHRTGQSSVEYGDDRGFGTTAADQKYDVATRRALEAGQSVIFERDGDVPAEVIDRLNECDLAAVYAIPLTHGPLSFGALTAVTTSPVTALEIDLLEEFADALAFKHHTYRQREALTTDRVLQVELRIEGDHVLSALAESLGQPFTAYELSPGNETVPYLIEIATDAESLEAAADAVSDIGELRMVTERDGMTVARAVGQRPTIGTVVGEYGGAIHSIAVGPDDVEVVLRFPPRTSLADMAAAVRTEWPDASIRSRQEQRLDGDRPSPFETLTEKQENALRAAVVAGFFDRPQEANAAEVAEAIGIARSTFLHHLRAAERKVFTEAFDE